MSARHDDLGKLLADMESDVRDLTRWVETIWQLGTSDYDPRICLLVIGPAMEDVARRVELDWERALDLYRGQQGTVR